MIWRKYVSMNVTSTISTKCLPLQWRHNGRDGISNHQPRDCLLNRLFLKKKHQSSASLAFVRGIHRWPVNSPQKGPVTRIMFPFDDVIVYSRGGGPFLPFSYTTEIHKHAFKPWILAIANLHFIWDEYFAHIHYQSLTFTQTNISLFGVLSW